MDTSAFEWGYAAGGQDVDGKIQRQRAGMEEIQRPKVNGPAGQISAARSLRNDGWAIDGVGLFPHSRECELYDTGLPALMLDHL